VAGGWRKLLYEKLHNLHSSSDINRMIKSGRMRWTGQVTRSGERRSTYEISVGKSEENRPLGRKRRRWDDNIKIDLGEMQFVGWIQNRNKWRALVNKVMNPRFL
jgi:hypothetical protein